MVKPQIHIEIHPDVYIETEFSMQWYESKSPNLGYDFLEQLNSSIEKIKVDPELWPWYDDTKTTRKFLVHRFPYVIIYRYKFPVVEIITIANLKRKPGYWNTRMKQR